jgi:hypothetical protein
VALSPLTTSVAPLSTVNSYLASEIALFLSSLAIAEMVMAFEPSDNN